MLGGSSGRNFLIYQRGTQSSYQKWVDAVGDETYTFENFLPYFEKSLKFTPPNNDLRPKKATHEFSTSALGTGNGPLSLSFPNWAYAFGTWATTAFSQIGIPLRREGFQNGGLLGHAYTMFTQNGDDMQRSSSETAFLRKALGNPNYYVYPLTMAKRILFDDDGGNGTKGRLTATGVVVETAGAEYAIAANREVILSAGVFGSPQLLQVSGIGPRDLLEPLGIPVMVDLPGVGQNMQDHIFFGIARGINAVTTSALGDPVFIAEQHRLFAEEANGLLTSSAADVLAWEKLPGAARQSLSNETKRYLDTFPKDWPDVEYVTFSAYLGDLSMPIAADPHDGTQYATVAAALAVPRSRGSVNITSSDVSTMPVIDPRFLTEKADMEVAVAGFRRMREFWNASSIEPLLTGDEAFPGVSVTDEYDSIEAWIRKSFMTVYHGSCTCAMGKASDPYAVVDPQGRVYNVDGLRVVDASAFPLLPPGHIQSTVCKYFPHFISPNSIASLPPPLPSFSFLSSSVTLLI